MQTPAARGALAVLLLRLGLGWFLLVWGVTKFLAPGHYVKLYAYFHGFDLAASLPYYMGAGQTVVAVAIILGLWRRASYAAGLLIHTITVAVVIGELVTPFVIEKGFPAHRNQTIALAAWGASSHSTCFAISTAGHSTAGSPRAARSARVRARAPERAPPRAHHYLCMTRRCSCPGFLDSYGFGRAGAWTCPRCWTTGSEKIPAHLRQDGNRLRSVHSYRLLPDLRSPL